jgi:hypothetical protein
LRSAALSTSYGRAGRSQSAGTLATSLSALALIVSAALFGAPDWLLIALFGMLLFSLASLSSAGSAALTSSL